MQGAFSEKKKGPFDDLHGFTELFIKQVIEKRLFRHDPICRIHIVNISIIFCEVIQVCMMKNKCCSNILIICFA